MSSQNNYLLLAALDYINRFNFSVIPCLPNKKPYIPWTEFQNRKPTQEEIQAWWERWPEALIGIVTGPISRLLVVDCDSIEAFHSIQELLPDSLMIPTVRTPRGRHFYFNYSETLKLTVGVGVVLGVDFRGQGGYAIAPPSCNGEGETYSWAESLSLDKVPLPDPPESLIKILNNMYRENKNAQHNNLTPPFNDLHFLTKGRRDSDLYHLATCLARGRCEVSIIEQTLNILAKNSNPPFPEIEIKAKIESAIKRCERRERNLKLEFLDWLALQEGYWNLTEAKKALQLLTKEDKGHLDVIVHRLRKEGIIEKYGNQAGVYRTVMTETEPIDFINCNVVPLSIHYPFRIEDYYKTLPKNIIVVAGSPDSGKTGFMLNFARLNQDGHEIHYFSSEMGPMEMRERLSKFDCPLVSWRIHFWERSSNFADVIRPDAINLIDFMELHSDFWQVGGMIKDIFDKLTTGIAVIAIQKPKGRDEGLGGERGLEKPRLYLAMESGRLKIVKCKNWVNPEKNPNGLTLDFKIIGGCKFLVTKDWYRP